MIAPDQLGFGASSRPDIHYSFHQMAQNTKALLDHLGVQQVDVIAHSMGGMLGVRFTLLFPETVEKLVLENPLGLEDYRKLVPYISLQQQYAAELSQTYEKMLDYHGQRSACGSLPGSVLINALVSTNEVVSGWSAIQK